MRRGAGGPALLSAAPLHDCLALLARRRRITQDFPRKLEDVEAWVARARH